MEVIGSLKSTLENELNEVVIEISLICRGIFNSSSYTSFDNSFTEKKFGKHDHSVNFQAFLRLLFHVLRRIAQRHFLVASYFNTKGESWNYGMGDVIAEISSLLEVSVAGVGIASNESKDTALAVTRGDLFRLSSNKHSYDSSGAVYDDLQQIAKDLQQFVTKGGSSVGVPANAAAFMAFLNQFIASKWIPKVKARAQQFLNMKYRSPNNSCLVVITTAL